MSYVDKIAKGSAIYFILSIVGAGLTYLVRIFLSRNLTAEQFGLFYSVSALIGIIGLFRHFGSEQSLTKHISSFFAKKQFGKASRAVFSIFSFQLVLGIILFIMVFILSDVLALQYFNNPLASIVLKVIAISYIFNSIKSKSVLRGAGKIKYISFSEPARNFLFLTLSLVLIGFGVGGVALARILAGGFVAVFFFVLMLKKTPINISEFKWDKGIFKKLFLFGLPIFASGIGNKLINHTDTLSITFFRSLEEVGFYEVAFPTARLVRFFSMALGMVLLPTFSEMWAKKEKKTLSKTLSLILKYTLMISIPFVLVFISFPEVIIRVMFGAEYLQAATALQILALSSLATVFMGIFTNTFVSVGRPKFTTKVISVVAVLNVILNVSLVPVFGIVGAAVATGVSYFIGLIFYVVKVEKIIPVGLNARDVLKIIFAGIVCLGSIFLSKTLLILHPWVEVIVTVGIGFFVYLILIVYTKSVRKSELRILNKANIWIPKWFKNLVSRVVKH